MIMLVALSTAAEDVRKEWHVTAPVKLGKSGRCVGTRTGTGVIVTLRVL